MSASDSHRDEVKGQTQVPERTNDELVAEIPPDRREFVKRMLVGAGALALITSLYIPQVMAKVRRSPNGYD